MATATRGHQPTASRHSPALVTACERPTSHPTQSDLPSVLLFVPHQLPMVFYSLQGPQASNSPLLFRVLVFFSLFFFFFLRSSCYRRKYSTALKDIYLYCLKVVGPPVFSHSIFITTYLDFLFLCFVSFFYWFMKKWTC